MNIYKKIASQLNIEPALIYAITKTESNGVFAYKNGKISVLMERHWIYKLTRKVSWRVARKLAKKHPELVNRRAGGYTKDEYKRITNACKYLALEFATFMPSQEAQEKANEIVYQSTSWGAFQIMGFNYKLCGYKSAVKMAEAYHTNPREEQIKGFLRFIRRYKKGKVLVALKNKNWQKVAYNYNGSGYKRNNYDKKLATAYNAFS